MSDMVDGIVQLSGERKRSTSFSEKWGRSLASVASQTFEQEENTYAELNRRVEKVAAVASLVTGSYSQNAAAHAYDKMNFKDDEYLRAISMEQTSTAAQRNLDSYLSKSVFVSEQERVSGLSVNGNNLNLDTSIHFLSNEERNQIKTSGTLDVGGVTYNAQMNGNNVSLSSFGGSFNDTQKLTIDINPLKGITTIDATVHKSSLSSDELNSVMSNKSSYSRTVGDKVENYDGCFTRNGVTYDVRFGDNPDRMHIHASASGSHSNVMLGAVNAPMGATYTMRGDSLSSNNLADAAKNGEYKLGGMTFKAGLNFNPEEFRARSASASNANANVMRDTVAFTKQGKAKVMQNVQNAGVNYIRNQGTYLNKHFNGSAESLRRCRNHLNAKLKKADGDAKLKADIERQLNLLDEYKKHGGTIGNPASNHRKSAGMMTIGNAVLGQDMMRGVKVYTGIVKTTQLTARTTGAVTAKLSYMGTSAANKIVAKGIGKVAGKDNTAYKTVTKMQEKNKKLYADRKDRLRAKKDGTYKYYKRGRRDERWANKGAKFDKKIDRAEAIKNRVAKDGKADKVLNWRQKNLERRKARYERVSKFRESIRNKFDIKGKIKNSRPVKAFGRAKSKIVNSKGFKIVSAPFKGIGALSNAFRIVKAFIYKIVFYFIIIYACCLLLLFAPFMVSYLFSRFFSTELLSGEALQNKLNSMNYQQMIVDTVNEDIAFDYKIVCQIDATFHYLSKRNVPSETYPWYVAPKFGAIEHQWAWEESDNSSRYLTEDDAGEYNDRGILIGSGDLMYEEYYIPQADRTEIDSITFNMYPIVAMSHMRYHDEFSFDQWESILGYTYYMFVVSHDISKYDTDQSEYHRVKEYGDDTFEPGYDYVISTCPDDRLYYLNLEWDPVSHSLTRSNEVCSNIYIHDFLPPDYTVKEMNLTCNEHYFVHNTKDSSSYSLACDGGSVFANSSRRWRDVRFMIADIANKIMKDPLSVKADSLDNGYTDVNSALTLAFRKKALKGIKIENNSVKNVKKTLEATIESLAEQHSVLDFDKNSSGVFIYDGDDNSLPHAQPMSSQLDTDSDEVKDELNGLGEVCDKYLELPYGIVIDSYLNVEEDIWKTEEGGTCDHVHVLECHPLICTLSESTPIAQIDPASGEILNKDEIDNAHKHGVSCYDTTPGNTICGHKHEPWQGKDNPGCWKTVCICPGHCGSHLDPKINIVQKVTYRGLADEDNFGTPYWLTYEEIVGAGGALSGGMYEMLNGFLTNDSDVVTVAKFRGYWYGKITQWFSPLPRSPWGFYKKIGEHYIETYVKVCDGFLEAIGDLFKYFFGDEDEKEERVGNKEGWNQSMEDGAEPDKWDWEGWWNKRGEFDYSLFDEVAALYGSWEEDQYKASTQFWKKDQMAGEAECIFPSVGIGGVVYSEEEINTFLDELLKVYSNLTPEQIAILKAGLQRCGTFSYSLAGAAHNNALKNGSGSGDCSGWVGGTLEAAGIIDPTGKHWSGLNAAAFANKGTYGAVKQPGSIIAHKNGGSGYSGHVMIYVGYLEDGPDGAGTYVMDCSSTTGGSSLRAMTQSQLDKYAYVYNPF